MDASDPRSSAPPADLGPAAGSTPSPAVTANRPGPVDQRVTRSPAAASAMGQIVAGGGALRIDYAGNLLRLAAALDRFADEPADIHIDLASVDFCDVACCGPSSCSAIPAANTPISAAGVSSCISPRQS